MREQFGASYEYAGVASGLGLLPAHIPRAGGPSARIDRGGPRRGTVPCCDGERGRIGEIPHCPGWHVKKKTGKNEERWLARPGPSPGGSGPIFHPRACAQATPPPWASEWGHSPSGFSPRSVPRRGRPHRLVGRGRVVQPVTGTAVRDGTVVTAAGTAAPALVLGLLDGPSSKLGTVHAIPGVPEAPAVEADVVFAGHAPGARLAVGALHRQVILATPPRPSAAQAGEQTGVRQNLLNRGGVLVVVRPAFVHG
jgi:hypothetical protein